MSHEIDTTTGRAAVMVAGEPAWHELGVNVSEAQNSEQAIELAALNWQVEQWPLWAKRPNHETWSAVSQRLANVRSDTHAVLGVVGDGYRVFQNREAFDFMDAIVGEKLAMYETAGSLKGGKVVWMLAKIPGEYRVGSDDQIKPYVLLTNSHDGSQALRMIPTTVRVVCWNTLNLAIGRSRSQEGLSIWHTASLDQRIEAARQNLGIISKRMQEFNTEIQQLAAKQLTTGEAGDYFGALFPTGETEGAKKSNEKALEFIWGAFDNPRNTLPGVTHTAWGAYNAVSEWCDHGRRVTGKSSADKTEMRLRSNWFGTSHRLKQDAFAQALGLAS